MTDTLKARSTLNPWLSIWTQPRATIQQISDTDPRRFVLVLAALAGFVGALNRASTRSAGDTLDTPEILVIALVAGPIGGILSLYILSFVIHATGSWINGKASYEQVRAAFAWSLVPYLVVSLAWIPELLLFWEEMFTSETPRLDADPVLALALVGMIAVELVGTVWAFVVYLKCLGQMQAFSAWKALGNVVLAGLVILLPIMVIAIALVSFTS